MQNLQQHRELGAVTGSRCDIIDIKYEGLGAAKLTPASIEVNKGPRVAGCDNAPCILKNGLFDFGKLPLPVLLLISESR